MDKQVKRIPEIQMPQNLTDAGKSLLEKGLKSVRKSLAARPQSLNDYYTLFGFLIAKKLAVLLVLLIGAGSLLYLVNLRPVQPKTSGGAPLVKAPAFRYSSPALRGYSGQAQILSGDGQVAYTGGVEEGKAAGEGILYDRRGNILYVGAFSGNQYNGKGTLYYEAGGVEYRGEFVNNVFNGTGVYFNPGGYKHYEGQYVNGMKNGEGILYNRYGNPVFYGNFHMNEPDFSCFIGDKVSKLTEAFTGKQTAYMDEDSSVLAMRDFDVAYEAAVYEGAAFADSTVCRMYYYGDAPFEGDHKYTADELDANMGTLYYKGDAALTLGEYAAAEVLSENGDEDLGEKYVYQFTDMFSDVRWLASHNQKDRIYLRAYVRENYFYTFYFTDIAKGYVFYSVEQMP